MNIADMTRDEFLCLGRCEEQPDVGFVVDLASELMPQRGALLWDLGAGYAIHGVNGVRGDRMLLHQGCMVGSYCGEPVSVNDNHIGRGLGAALVISAAPDRESPTYRRATKRGLATLERAWRIVHGEEQAPGPTFDGPRGYSTTPLSSSLVLDMRRKLSHERRVKNQSSRRSC